MTSSTQPHGTIWRLILLTTGIFLLVVSPIVGAIPGPGGIFVFAGGLVLVLRNSLWARRAFVRAKHRWPRLGGYADRALRRGSERRRRKRDRERAAGRTRDPAN